LSVVKEYIDKGTKIRIHDDYLETEDKKNEIKDIIISLILGKLQEENYDKE